MLMMFAENLHVDKVVDNLLSFPESPSSCDCYLAVMVSASDCYLVV
jgi:hypothetical protein